MDMAFEAHVIHLAHYPCNWLQPSTLLQAADYDADVDGPVERRAQGMSEICQALCFRE